MPANAGVQRPGNGARISTALAGPRSARTRSLGHVFLLIVLSVDFAPMTDIMDKNFTGTDIDRIDYSVIAYADTMKGLGG